jgi:hypothetical protein
VRLKKIRMPPAVIVAAAAILLRSEGVCVFVKSKNRGRLPKGSMMIRSGTRIVRKE